MEDDADMKSEQTEAKSHPVGSGEVREEVKQSENGNFLPVINWFAL
jgi:hypothetical protein